MDVEAARLIGAGLAIVSLGGVGIAIGNIFAALIEGMSRNPESAKDTFPRALLGFALVEAVALYALLVSFLILDP